MRGLMRCTTVVAGAVVVTLSSAIGIAAARAVPPRGGASAPARAAPFQFDAYVANYGPGTVRVMNTATNTIITTIAVGTKPAGLAIGGGHAYVTNSGSNTVSVIDTATNTVTNTILVGTTPLGVAVTQGGGHAYVTNYKSNSVSVIDTATNTVTATIPVAKGPWGIAITPDGKRVYVTDTLSDKVSVIDTATNTVTATMRGFATPWGIVAAPDGSHVYITNALSDTVSVIDTATNKAVATVHVGSFPYGVAVSPYGKRVYVTNTFSNTVSVIDTATNRVISTVDVGIRPHGVAVAPDGGDVFVADNKSNSVSIIDTRTGGVATMNRFLKPEGVAPPAAAMPTVFAGYADSLTTAGSHPHPWQGDRHVIFEGCNYFTPSRRPKFLSGCARYDAGALMLQNPMSHSMTVTRASVRIGSHTFYPWPGLHVTLPGHDTLILTQTGAIFHNLKLNFNFNTSKATPTNKSCTNDKLIPGFHVTVDGQALRYKDTRQILNTGGTDPGRARCGSHNETRNWAPVSLSP